ncbi:uncharacterized protein B0H18DRAFT_1124094 [Fomitopsis serialis]|uniref:uncharacterized protein n=1 Tax=Fomitopsis serialis TaxID=139415 RepID=UPI002007FB69|nr:uncharacterized protein B0H18DRAFT_1124094 [Neoantrodia serialis]KAH9916680.1 hypothetical protein B0H18DRAFT_1124094 [Neoantrodia serialis]
MPKTRQTRNASKNAADFSTRFTGMRSELRELITKGLREFTGKPGLEMVWTRDTFLELVKAERVRLRGWPTRIPFANFSKLPGAQKAVRELRYLWDRKELVWESIPDAEFPALDLVSALPSWTPKQPRKLNIGRSDIGSTRERRVTRARYPRSGAKTPAIVSSSLDSEIEDFSDEERVTGRARKRVRREYKSAEYIADSDEAEPDEIDEFSD